MTLFLVCVAAISENHGSCVHNLVLVLALARAWQELCLAAERHFITRSPCFDTGHAKVMPGLPLTLGVFFLLLFLTCSDPVSPWGGGVGARMAALAHFIHARPIDCLLHARPTYYCAILTLYCGRCFHVLCWCQETLCGSPAPGFVSAGLLDKPYSGAEGRLGGLHTWVICAMCAFCVLTCVGLCVVCAGLAVATASPASLLSRSAPAASCAQPFHFIPCHAHCSSSDACVLRCAPFSMPAQRVCWPACPISHCC